MDHLLSAYMTVNVCEFSVALNKIFPLNENWFQTQGSCFSCCLHSLLTESWFFFVQQEYCLLYCYSSCLHSVQDVYDVIWYQSVSTFVYTWRTFSPSSKLFDRILMRFFLWQDSAFVLMYSPLLRLHLCLYSGKFISWNKFERESADKSITVRYFSKLMIFYN